MTFDLDEVARIEDAQLILLGIPPSEVAQMSIQQRYDVLEIHKAIESLKQNKLPT